MRGRMRGGKHGSKKGREALRPEVERRKQTGEGFWGRTGMDVDSLREDGSWILGHGLGWVEGWQFQIREGAKYIVQPRERGS